MWKMKKMRWSQRSRCAYCTNKTTLPNLLLETGRGSGERTRERRERQKRTETDEQASHNQGEQDGMEVNKAAMSGAERTRKWRERQKRKTDEHACGQGEQDGTEVDKDEDELEEIASDLDEAIQECVKECQEMLGSAQVGEGTFQARVCVSIIKVSDPLDPIP